MIQFFYLVILPIFHADHTSSKNGSYFLENIFVSVGVAYDFAFRQNNLSLKIFQNVFWKFPSKSLGNEKVFGG